MSFVFSFFIQVRDEFQLYNFYIAIMQLISFARKQPSLRLLRSHHNFYEVNGVKKQISHSLECKCGTIVSYQNLGRHLKASCNANERFVFQYGANGLAKKTVCVRCCSKKKPCPCGQLQDISYAYLSKRNYNEDVKKFYKINSNISDQKVNSILLLMAEMGEKRLNGFKKRLTKPDTDDEIEVSEENIYALLGLPRRRFQFMRIFAAIIQFCLMKQFGSVEYLNVEILQKIVTFVSPKVNDYIPDWTYAELLEAFDGFTEEGYFIPTENIDKYVESDKKLRQKTIFLTKSYLTNVLGINEIILNKQFIPVEKRVFIQKNFHINVLKGIFTELLDTSQPITKIDMGQSRTYSKLIGEEQLQTTIMVVSKMRNEFIDLFRGIQQHVMEQIKQFKILERKQYAANKSQMLGLLGTQNIQDQEMGQDKGKDMVTLDQGEKTLFKKLSLMKKVKIPKLQQFDELVKCYNMCVKDGNLIRNKPESKYFEFFTSFEEQEMTKVISVNNLYDIKHAEIFYDIVMQKAMIKQIYSKIVTYKQLQETFNRVKRNIYVSLGDQLSVVYQMNGVAFDVFFGKYLKTFIKSQGTRFSLRKTPKTQSIYCMSDYDCPVLTYKALVKCGKEKKYSLTVKSLSTLVQKWAIQNQDASFTQCQWYTRARLRYEGSIKRQEIFKVFPSKKVLQMFIRNGISPQKQEIYETDFVYEAHIVIVQEDTKWTQNEINKGVYFSRQLMWLRNEFKNQEINIYQEETIWFETEMNIAKKIFLEVFTLKESERIPRMSFYENQYNYRCVSMFNINKNHKGEIPYLLLWQKFYESYQCDNLEKRFQEEFKISQMRPCDFRSNKFKIFKKEQERRLKAIAANQNVRTLYYTHQYGKVFNEMILSDDFKFNLVQWSLDQIQLRIRTENQLYQKYANMLQNQNKIKRCLKPLVIQQHSITTQNVNVLQFTGVDYVCCQCRIQLIETVELRFQCHNDDCPLYKLAVTRIQAIEQDHGDPVIRSRTYEKNQKYILKIGKQKNNITEKIRQLNANNPNFRQISNLLRWNGSLNGAPIQISLQISKQTNIINYFKEYEYIPVEIRYIDQNKGHGVFAKQSFENNSIITTYSGDLFFADELNLNGSDNDIVEVGMIKNRVIILKPKYVVNLGRYLNSPFDPKKANCKPCWKAFNYDGKICIGLFLITCKRVKAGEQLTWYYNGNFMQTMENINEQAKQNIQIEVKHMGQHGYQLQIVDAEAIADYVDNLPIFQEAYEMEIDEQIKEMNFYQDYQFKQKERKGKNMFMGRQGVWSQKVYANFILPSSGQCYYDSKSQRKLELDSYANKSAQMIEKQEKQKKMEQTRRNQQRLKEIQKFHLFQIQGKLNLSKKSKSQRNTNVQTIQGAGQPRKRVKLTQQLGFKKPVWYLGDTPNPLLIKEVQSLLNPKQNCEDYDVIQQLKKIYSRQQKKMDSGQQKDKIECKSNLDYLDKILSNSEKLQQVQIYIKNMTK